MQKRLQRLPFFGNSMHNNSFFLMAAQGLVTVFGYLFWIIVAHLYKSSSVGLAGTLISIATLISQISILGLNNAIVRFLPGSKNKNEKINTCLMIVTVAAFVIALGYVFGMPLFSPKLLFIRHDPLLLGLFVFSMVLVTLNTFTDSVFLVNRATKYNVLIYGAYSLLRLSLPFAFARYGIIGIFGAHIAGVALAVFLSFYYMVRKLNYRFSFTFSKSIARMIGGYSAASYVAGFLWVLPMLIAPVFVVNQLGAQSAAYFYMVNTIVSCLLIIPLATSQALFAEGSHATHELRQLVGKSLRVTMALVTVGVVGLLALGKLVILVFGHEYIQGIGLLYLLTATTLIVALNMTGNTILKIKQQTWRLIGVNLLAASLTITTFRPFMQHYGLIGIGIAYLLGQAVMLCVFGGMLFGAHLLQRRAHANSASLSARTATE